MEKEPSNPKPTLPELPTQNFVSASTKSNRGPLILILVGIAALIGIVGILRSVRTKPSRSSETNTTSAISCVSPSFSIQNVPSVAVLPSQAVSPSPTISRKVYIVPSNWKKTLVNNSITLCLPPKWEAEGNALYFNRDPAYRPEIAEIKAIAYTSGSQQDAYFAFWKSEYPNVEDLMIVQNVAIGNNTALMLSPKYDITKISAPDSLAILWYTDGKLWLARTVDWHQVNDSQSAFLTDFYTAISCSFSR